MTNTSTRRVPERQSDSRGASERRVEALVAAYIHEQSHRHRAQREAREAVPAAAEART
jgi:hypothetical protein